jgi:cytochrome P450
VSVNQRAALRTTILPTGGGPDGKSPVLVRKGQSLAYSVYSLHRRADLYGEDAEEFRPERWDEDLGLYRDELTKNWGYLPFNGGPRICLGSKFRTFPAQSAY